MRSLWNDEEAAQYQGDLGMRVYTSRLLGRDKSLVLHGGGNTSVKISQKNLFGEDEDILYVKGSGWDLEFIEAAGFSPVLMPHLLKLAGLDSLSDLEMVNELRTHMTRASAPTPSVEAILHATLPFKYVDHTHADAVVTITNTPDGEHRIREIYGDKVVVIPYIMPGFDLARLCARVFPAEAGPQTVGMVLLNHGIFSFGENARQSYERMIELVDLAERYLAEHDALHIQASADDRDIRPASPDELAALRHGLSDMVGRPMILSSHRDAASLNFVRHEKISTLSQQGPATPDHVIRTKRLPMLGRDLDAYAGAYREYFDSNAKTTEEDLSMLDPAPRVILDRVLGMCSVGGSAREADIVADIYQHTMEIVLRSAALGGYQALPASDIFDVEYWELEQAKLKKGGSPPLFAGEVALITGAASGIGKACVDAFLKRGAAVIGLDANTAIETLLDRPDYLGIHCDVTDPQQISDALQQGVARFGGLDMLVLNAGMFPGGCPISELGLEQWNKVMDVNLDANVTLMREAYPLLKQAPKHGRVVIMGSKNVPAPGPGAAAYSASKAALNQLARIAALEWGADGIRINSLHPDAVFDTGIWTEEVIAARAKHYDMSVEQYKTKNVLKTEITSHDVAELAAEMCGPLFAKTTASQVPVDGGNDRVI
jgi:rhamnose utilization protein RhaD (predicted bifunctional aldolase and dehydrogenase)/NAD(P)-dependent dehydrogenase (short-subunit alcohol dehydrogenase family)